MGWKKKLGKILGKKIPLIPFQMIARIIPIRLLYILGVLVFSIIPSILGTYGYLRYNGVSWPFALLSSFGVEIGGPVFSILNNAQALGQASGLEMLIVFIGLLIPLLHLHWLYTIYKSINQLVDPTVSIVLIWLWAGLILGPLIGLTLLVDQVILTEQQLRLSGITYFLNSPRAALDPLLQLAGPHFSPEQAFNGTEILKKTIDNTSVGG